MIIVGYQGIGKSTLARDGNGYIDLESGNFWVNGYRADDWYKPYCQMAVHLSQQGYTVFLSSHKVVREYLGEIDQYSEEQKIIVCPAIALKKAWVKRLGDRYQQTTKEKDYKAMMNAIDCYNENIQELLDEPGFEKIVIQNMDYDLKLLLEGGKRE